MERVSGGLTVGGVNRGCLLWRRVGDGEKGSYRCCSISAPFVLFDVASKDRVELWLVFARCWTERRLLYFPTTQRHADE